MQPKPSQEIWRVSTPAMLAMACVYGVGCGRIGYGEYDRQEATAGSAGASSARGGAGGILNDGSAGGGVVSDGAFVDAASPDVAGCPTRIDLGSAANTPLRGIGVVSSTDACPAGQAIIGYTGSTGGRFVETLQTQCGVLSLVAEGASCRIAVSAGTTLPLRGNATQSSPWSQRCPPDEVVVVVNGHAGGRVDELGFECAPLVLARTGSSFTVTLGPVTQLMAQGGPGGTAFRDPCPGNSIANGNLTGYTGWIDAFQLTCSSLDIIP